MATEFLTVAECAEQVGVSKMTIYRLTQDGVVPCIRVGRSYRIPAAAWKAYLALPALAESADLLVPNETRVRVTRSGSHDFAVGTELLFIGHDLDGDPWFGADGSDRVLRPDDYEVIG